MYMYMYTVSHVHTLDNIVHVHCWLCCLYKSQENCTYMIIFITCTITITLTLKISRLLHTCTCTCITITLTLKISRLLHMYYYYCLSQHYCSTCSTTQALPPVQGQDQGWNRGWGAFQIHKTLYVQARLCSFY